MLIGEWAANLHGTRFLSAESINNPKLPIRIYADNHHYKDELNLSQTFLTGVIKHIKRDFIGIHGVIDLRTLGPLLIGDTPQEEQSNRLGYAGQGITQSEWDKATSFGCSRCQTSSNVRLEELYSWLSPTEYLCENCSLYSENYYGLMH